MSSKSWRAFSSILESNIPDFSEEILTWVSENYSPENIFSKEVLMDWVKKNCSVGEVFDKSDLEDWANGNGYRYGYC